MRSYFCSTCVTVHPIPAHSAPDQNKQVNQCVTRKPLQMRESQLSRVKNAKYAQAPIKYESETRPKALGIPSSPLGHESKFQRRSDIFQAGSSWTGCDSTVFANTCCRLPCSVKIYIRQRGDILKAHGICLMRATGHVGHITGKMEPWLR